MKNRKLLLYVGVGCLLLGLLLWASSLGDYQSGDPFAIPIVSILEALVLVVFGAAIIIAGIMAKPAATRHAVVARWRGTHGPATLYGLAGITIIPLYVAQIATNAYSGVIQWLAIALLGGTIGLILEIAGLIIAPTRKSHLIGVGLMAMSIGGLVLIF